MRTRFISSGFFNSAPIQTLDFLHCSPPRLPPSCISIVDDARNCFDDLSVLRCSLEVENLPIETSLAKFLSDVLPQFIDVQIGDFGHDITFAETPCSRKPRSNTVDHTLQIDALPEKDERSSDIEGTTDIKLIQFEAPEVHPISEMNYDLHCQRVDVKVFSEISHVECEVDMPSLELRMQDFLEIQSAVYSVYTISTEHFKERKADLLEGSDSTGGQLDSSSTPFPVFEIDEESMSVFNDISVRDELKTFDNIECETWVQEHQIPSSDKGLLDSIEFDLLVHLSDHCPAMQCPRLEVTCSSFCQEMDFISGCEDSDIFQLLLHQGISQDVLLCPRNIVLFEEFQFTGMELYNFVEVFHDSGTMFTIKSCDSIFSEAMKFKSFSDLIVCNELILVDDSFKSLPAPILSNSENIWSFHSLVERMLSVLEPESSSTFDGLYLDWHVLEEDKCDKYSSCWRMLEEIDMCNIGYNLSIYDNRILLLKFLLSSDCSDEPNLGGDNEISDILLKHISVPPIPLVEVTSQMLGNDNHSMGATKEISSEFGAAKIHISVDSSAKFTDTSSPLIPSDCAGRKKYKPSGRPFDKNMTLSAGSSGDSIAACAATQVQQWNIKILPVELSDEILLLIGNFQKSFMDILWNDTLLMKSLQCYQDLDGISCLRLRKEELIDHIKRISAPGTPKALANDKIVSLVTLCAIKQMAWYMCYYGLHPTQLYIDKLTSSLQCLKSRLSFLQNLIQDMCKKAEKEITKFHPSLSVIQDMLESNFSEIDRKVLIVAEPIFWWTLKKLLNSMGISYHEPQNYREDTYQQDGLNEFPDAWRIMFQSDCCLVTHEYVSTSFPFDKFGIILEYGGSHELSRICNISVKQDNCPRLYFLKVQMEDSGVSKAICEGVDMPKLPESSKNGDPHIASVLNVNHSKVEELLNFMPVEEHCKSFPEKAVDEGEECCVELVQSVSLDMESEKPHVDKKSSPDIVIVVNTRNFDKEMVISRRSTYQKILALEKGGAQIVERDLNLPVDVVVDAAICIAWYDLKNIGKKASASDEAVSCLALCVESIAASILTSMSYAFSSCILIFEGEKNFLAGVVESSDELYAAAASLGIDFQIFCSYSPVMTDEILLSCIEAVTKLSRGLYPTMPDSESLAESFLTAFPSINPLSAHGILSSGGILVEFLEWSHDHRMHLVQKYKIPDDSVILFGLLCQYGEREDSKSGMTDSSSSVSYTSDRFQLKSNSEARKRKYIDDLRIVDVNINELSSSLSEPLPLFSDIQLSPPRASAPINFWMSGISETEECNRPGLSSDNKKLQQSRKLSANMMMNSSKLSSLYGFEMGEGPTSEESKKPMKPWNDSYFAPTQTVDMLAWNKRHRHEHEKSGNSLEDVIGEVIDTDVCATFSKDISALNSLKFSSHEVENDSASGISRAVNKLSFGATNFSTFSTPAEISYKSDVWISNSKSENSSRKANKSAPDSSFSKCEFHSEQLKGHLHNDKLQKTTSDACYQSMQKMDGDHLCGTPLWNAIHSSGCQQLRESPWTIEFLNRIKEKSRTRQQSLPCGSSPTCFKSSRNKSNASKRKSPSILEYYKYQRDGISKKSIDYKRPKKSVKPSLLHKHQKASDSILPTWTPVDKRAKSTLSFATLGSGGQSKLIWSDEDSHPFHERVFS